MRNIVFLILFAPLTALGQDSATYTFRLDTFGIDSFFLVETVSTPQPGLPRGTETEYSTYFTDTAALSAHIVGMQAEYTAITAQAVELGKRKAAWDYRYQRAVCLRDSVFYGASCTGIGSRIVTAPPPEPDVVPATGGGFWIVYAKGGFEWLTDIKKTKARGTVLNRNGTTMTIDPPQKKPVKKKPK